jgi:DNA (cytosine-5)-methyltransferase 1
MDSTMPTNAPTFIDLFSGCGGLSLGLSQAGWRGVFAIERAVDAFRTFEANFLSNNAQYPFLWPNWLERRAHSIDEVLESHRSELLATRGAIDLIAGGPPCQGFSFAGKRNAADPRNDLFERYVSFVDLLRPKFLVLENVPGMDMVHLRRAEGKKSARSVTFYERLVTALNALGYVASNEVLDAKSFGVPQRRARLEGQGWLSLACAATSQRPSRQAAPAYSAGSRKREDGNSHTSIRGSMGSLQRMQSPT